jgi:hypothetical protein
MLGNVDSERCSESGYRFIPDGQLLRHLNRRTEWRSQGSASLPSWQRVGGLEVNWRLLGGAEAEYLKPSLPSR